MTNLGGFSEKALKLFQEAASERAFEFSEMEETYDFTRCVRPDGSAYGTGGRCVKGSQQDKVEQAKQENKQHQMAMKNAQADRAALTKKVAKEMGKDVTDVAVAKEVARRQEEMAKKRESYNKEGAARGEAERKKNIADAKANIKEIEDEIKNRGPHSAGERERLATMLKQAEKRLERFETGKMMTREEFQAGLKKMK